MKISIFVTIFFMSLFALGNPKVINIGIIPSEDPEMLRTVGLELAKAIQEKVGLQTNIFVSKNYSGLIEAMKNKKVDFAFFTAMSFVFAEKQSAAKVLLKKVWQNPYYYSAILTLKASKIAGVDNLKGKTIGFVDERSTSGYLYPQVYFHRKKINPAQFFKKVVFTGNHQKSVESLAKGEVDAIAVFADEASGLQNAWEKFAPAERKSDAAVLWVSQPIPNDPFCVRQDFYEKFPSITYNVMSSLIDLKEENPSILKRLFGIKAFELATSKQYEPVREMVRELNLRME